MKVQILRFFFALTLIFIVGASAFAQTRTDVYAVTNAKIVTVSGKIIERGTIVVRDGLIESVGENVRVPADARVFDGAGLTVYPGFFDTLTSLAIQTATPPATNRGGQNAGATTTASSSNYPDGLRPEETAFEKLKITDAAFETQRNAGFTTVLTVGKDGIFNGQSAVINLSGDSVSEAVIKSPFAEHITLTTLRGGQYPTSLMGTFSALRQMFLDAQRFAEIKKMYAASQRGMQRPPSDASLEALLPIVGGTMPIVFNANTEVEINRILDLTEEFKLKTIIAGGQEAWKTSNRLKLLNVPVLLSLDFPKRTASASAEADPEPLELLRFRAETPKAAARLQAAGVKFAFQSGGMKSIGDFLTNAGKAVENGLSRDAAIRAMTLSAAEILGVNNQLGSIEAGKIANLVVTRGDIFAKDKTITHVFVDGKLFEQKEKPKTPPNQANQPGKTTTSNSVASVGGSYNITIEIPGQPATGTLSLVQQDTVLTGELQTQFGATPIKDGKVSADGFSFATTVEFGGQTFELNITGRVEGDKISGTVSSPQGAIPFSGTKIP